MNEQPPDHNFLSVAWRVGERNWGIEMAQETIYAVHPKLQAELVDQLCFKKCGRIGMAFLLSSIGVLAPCIVPVCPYAEGEMELGECDQGPVVLRKLRNDERSHKEIVRCPAADEGRRAVPRGRLG